jgi:hypothetical protein
MRHNEGKFVRRYSGEPTAHTDPSWTYPAVVVIKTTQPAQAVIPTANVTTIPRA